MQWNELIEICAELSGLTPEKAQKVLDAAFDTMISELAARRPVCLRQDFGRFEIRERGGEQVEGRRDQFTKMRAMPIFKSSAMLKKTLRQSDDDYVIMLRERGANKMADHFAFLLKHSKNRSAG